MSRHRHIFGLHAVAAALDNDAAHVRVIWLDGKRHDQRLGALLATARQYGIEIQHCERHQLDKMSGGARHQGIVADYSGGATRYRETDLEELLERSDRPSLLLVLDGVQDPHNLGACLRTADAAGVDAVLAPADRAVGLTPAVHKVASGAAETVAFIQVGNLARTLRRLQQRGIWIIGADSEAGSSLYDIDFTLPSAIVMGAEGKGLRRLTRENCDHLVAIPMSGSVASLNVSVATAVLLFEAVRQRRRGD